MTKTYLFCFEDSELLCELDYEPRDTSCGIFTASVDLYSASLNGVNIITLLSDKVISEIKTDALQFFIDEERDERESDY